MPKQRYAANSWLWIDCLAAFVAGTASLLLIQLQTALYALPRDLLLGIAGANLLYACYSFTLAALLRRRMGLIVMLVMANLVWVCICLLLAYTYAGSASLWGVAHLLGEAIFVAVLAGLEWRNRHALLSPVQLA
ncbi:hypothetical protein [Chitinimonas sp. BJYL2]|uniref:hypothetical protein n=1 Tax=Chitinimonas sp. BJYL2 TaxID=2976696 RepID=UPI0022B4BEAD|nr:hypothetical protein [Chitinimonas sp. BJYL2]